MFYFAIFTSALIKGNIKVIITPIADPFTAVTFWATAKAPFSLFTSSLNFFCSFTRKTRNTVSNAHKMIPPAKFWGVYSDPYVRLFVPISNPLLL